MPLARPLRATSSLPLGRLPFPGATKRLRTLGVGELTFVNQEYCRYDKLGMVRRLDYAKEDPHTELQEPW